MSAKDDQFTQTADAHGSCAPSAGSAHLMRQLYSYRAMMAPHQRERQGGRLLCEAISEIERLRGIIARNARTRLDENGLYVTAQDIGDSLEILYAEMEREGSGAPNAGLCDGGRRASNPNEARTRHSQQQLVRRFMKPDQYPRTHAIAHQLLAMDDAIAILPMAVFDSPGEMQALPVSVEAQDIQGNKCVVFRPLREDSANAEVSHGDSEKRL